MYESVRPPAILQSVSLKERDSPTYPLPLELLPKPSALIINGFSTCIFLSAPLCYQYIIMSKKVLIYGGRGALGSTLVSHFKSCGWWVCSVDLVASDDADANIIVDPKADWTTQGFHIFFGFWFYVYNMREYSETTDY